jgi:PPM family protein phosphatase
MHIYGRTDRGRVRNHNEDYFLTDSALGIAAIADGMGGRAAGEVASACAVHAVADYLRHRSALLPSAPRPAPEVLGAVMREALHAGNRAVRGLAATTNAYRGMGATLVAAALWHQHCVVGHVGDARAYRFRFERLGVEPFGPGHSGSSARFKRGGASASPRLERLTRDHSVVQDLVDAGHLSAAEARRAPNRHLVTQAVGIAEQMGGDVVVESVTPGDVYLLCSDGLTDMLDDDAITERCAHALAARQDARSTVRTLVNVLVAEALERGGNDNVTVVGLLAD